MLGNAADCPDINCNRRLKTNFDTDTTAVLGSRKCKLFETTVSDSIVMNASPSFFIYFFSPKLSDTKSKFSLVDTIDGWIDR